MTDVQTRARRVAWLTIVFDVSAYMLAGSVLAELFLGAPPTPQLRYTVAIVAAVTGVGRALTRAAVIGRAGALGEDPAEPDRFAQAVGRRLRPLLTGTMPNPDGLVGKFSFHGALNFGVPVVEARCMACQEWTFRVDAVLAAAMWEVLEEHHGLCPAAGGGRT